MRSLALRSPPAPRPPRRSRPDPPGPRRRRARGRHAGGLLGLRPVEPDQHRRRSARRGLQRRLAGRADDEVRVEQRIVQRRGRVEQLDPIGHPQPGVRPAHHADSGVQQRARGARPGPRPARRRRSRHRSSRAPAPPPDAGRAAGGPRRPGAGTRTRARRATAPPWAPPRRSGRPRAPRHARAARRRGRPPRRPPPGSGAVEHEHVGGQRARVAALGPRRATRRRRGRRPSRRRAPGTRRAPARAQRRRDGRAAG